MDYELKYVIAICLIVKIAALSPEFSISEETKKPEQISSVVETPFLPSMPAEETLSARRLHRKMVSNQGFGLEKLNRVKSVSRPRKIKETQSFDIFEHKLELLENSLKWRDIRKTLQWLDRLIASNKTTMEQCHKRKNLKRRASKNFDSHSSKHKKFLKNKKLADSVINWTKNWPPKNSNHSKKHKKFKKFWKNRSKKEKLKSKQKQDSKESRFEKKNLQKSKFSLPMQNTTILKPNSVLYDIEEMFFKKKNKGENLKNQECLNWVGVTKTCQIRKKTSLESEWESIKRKKTDNRSVNMRLIKHDHENNKTKLPKQKPWPHFVYHRVSSNFLHPESTGQNSKKSAYIAISVVTATKPD